MLIYWFAMQLFGGYGSLSETSQGGTAFFAHIGGFIAGIVLIQLLGTRAALLAPQGSVLVMKPRVTLYTRVGCCLCEEAKKVLAEARRRADFDYEELDIDLDPELLRRYNDEVPVIAINRSESLQVQSGPRRIPQETGGARMSLDVLAIAAHPDDVEQTCGGTLIRMAEAGYRTGVLDLTAGDMGTRGIAGTARGRKRSRRQAYAAAVARQPAFPRRASGKHLTARLTLAMKIRELAPRVVILPYWEARHPDHYRCGEMGFEACFLAGLKKIDEYSAPHRPQKILYASLYADVKPSFIVDISGQFERRMTALLSYASQYGAVGRGGASVSRRGRDPRAPGRHRAVLRQPDRREIRRAFRGEGSDPDRRYRGDAGAVDLYRLRAADYQDQLRQQAHQDQQ
jgi:N-acetylglucosamine malate deacetylase 1